MDELQRQLKAFSKRYGAKGQQVRARIESLMAQGIKPEEAVRQAFQEYGMEEWLQANVADAIASVAEVTLGENLAQNLSSAALLEALSNPWDGSGMKLSEKIHGASKAMRDAIASAVKQQVCLNKTVRDTARALYDGYNAGHIVQKQDLPQYMDELMTWTRRSRDNLTEVEARELQRFIRKVRTQAEGLVDDRSTYNHYRTSLNVLLDKIDQGSEQAVQNAVRAAIEEKGRYIAERIARTEAARARYDAFIARYGNDDSVAAYQWKLGSRHPAEDICDMYAHADLYGLGRGVFPKGQAPVNPAHPHCLCHYAPVYSSELKGRKWSDNVESRGNAWLKQQPLHIRQAILGVKGEQEWKVGRTGWMEKANNLQSKLIESRLKSDIINVRYGKWNTDNEGHFIPTVTYKIGEKIKITARYIPNAIVEYYSQNGKDSYQRNLSLYDTSGMLSIQMHGGAHGNLKQHPYTNPKGKKDGKHVHIFTLKNGAISSDKRRVHSMTKEERRLFND